MTVINVVIDKAQKLNGEYSLFVTFDYDAQVVDVIRDLPSKWWHADVKTWEVPLMKLPVLLQKLPSHQFNISGQYVTIKKETHKIPDGFSFKTTPFEHQKEAFQFGLDNDKWLLGDEQGCIDGNSIVQIKEKNKKSTRRTKLSNLYNLIKKDSTIQIKCLVNGRFCYMPIKCVVDKGLKSTIQLVLEDTDLVCTPDHLIYTERGWVQAQDLKIGDRIFTNGKQVCPLCGTDHNLITYKYSKFLGYCKNCMYKEREGTKFKGDVVYKEIDSFGYVRLKGKPTRNMPSYGLPGGIYEHHQVWYENTGHIVDTTKEVIHHINGVKTDNRFENLKLMSIQEHNKLHSATKTNYLYQFNDNLDYIIRNGTRIELVPKLQTLTNIIPQEYPNRVYDVEIEDENIHNFIVNNIIVHNCGKTKQGIDIAVAKKLEKGYQHCLIICGVNGLKWNWQKEIEIHSNEHGYILGQKLNSKKQLVIGSNTDKYNDVLDLHNNSNYFIITNVESLRNEDICKALAAKCKSGEIGMIITDEVHKMKNPTSQQGKAFLKLQAETMIAMTGTPLMNNPFDLYIILKWLGVEKNAFYSFKKHYGEFGGYGGYEVIGYKHLDELQEQLNSIMLRRRKADVLDLPEKIYIDEYVDLTPKQAQIYKEVTADIMANIDQIKMDSNPLAQLIRLRQATGYTGILSSVVKESAKLDRMEELVDEAIENGNKVVIFSNWTQITDEVQKRLSRYHSIVITGQTKDADRQPMVDAFQNDPNVKVAIGSTGAMGTGLTLTAGTVEIFLDEPWSKALKSQAEDRCHRVGTTQNITIYTLLTKDTIDERIHDIVEQKGEMADAMVDGKVDMDKGKLVDFLLS